MVFLLTKGNGDFMGVGILQVICNTILGMINFRIGDAITYYYIICNFRAGRGMGDSFFEPKMLQKLT